MNDVRVDDAYYNGASEYSAAAAELRAQRPRREEQYEDAPQQVEEMGEQPTTPQGQEICPHCVGCRIAMSEGSSTHECEWCSGSGQTSPVA